MREAFHAGCRLASNAITTTMAAMVTMSMAETAGASRIGSLCMPKWKLTFHTFKA